LDKVFLQERNSALFNEELKESESSGKTISGA